MAVAFADLAFSMGVGEQRRSEGPAAVRVAGEWGKRGVGAHFVELFNRLDFSLSTSTSTIAPEL
jgi:hypothetical protein